MSDYDVTRFFLPEGFAEPLGPQPMAFEHWAEWGWHLSRIDMGGNDGADIWEFCEWSKGLADCYGYSEPEKLEEEMRTWITDRMGKAFDPEKHCPYTGRRLWKFPLLGPGGWSMMYFREPDAYPFRCRSLEPAELAWIERNPEPYAVKFERFDRWRKTCQSSIT